MTLMGTIKNGTVILDGDPVIADGTRVRIWPATDGTKGFTLDDLDAIGRPVLHQAYPGEFDDIYRSMKEDEQEAMRQQEERDRKLLK